MPGKYFITAELKQLVKVISCNFVDAHTTSKEFVKTAHSKKYVPPLEEQNFSISTCLRTEHYQFGNSQKLDEFFHVEGLLCLRRLLQIMVGLQSEIVGEKEILLQIANGIDKAYLENRLSRRIFQGFQDLIEIAQKIRIDYKIETDENYSTIGAKLLQRHIRKSDTGILLVIGGGYMIESFVGCLESNIKEIVWANRDPNKLSRIVEKFENISQIDMKFISLTEINEYASKVDAVFAAVSGDFNISNLNFRKECQIIDVSYPPIFKGLPNHLQMNISNTFFSHFRRKLKKTDVESALSQINEVIYGISKP